MGSWSPKWGWETSLPLHPHPRAFHEGGVAGVVEGLAPKERCLPPQECLRMWAGLWWKGAMNERKNREREREKK